MVLFPIAFIWLLAVMIWLIRNSLNEPDEQPGEPQRWYPRGPRRPGDRPPSAGSAARVSRPAPRSAGTLSTAGKVGLRGR